MPKTADPVIEEEMWQISTADIFKCLSDESRLRILHLLSQRPLCGCHFIEVLGLDQVKISKLLTYMKRLGMVEATREANWMVYRLAEPGNPIIAMNLDCLVQYSANVAKLFSTDLRQLAHVMARIRQHETDCPKLVMEGSNPS